MGGVVYLLHFDKSVGAVDNPHAQARHYLGWALDLAARPTEHRAGRGSALTRAVVERGIRFDVVRTRPGDRTMERRLKQRKEAQRLCPVCGVIHRRTTHQPA